MINIPIEKGKRYKDWHCSICGKTYKKRNGTRRDVLNAWWKHMKEYHPRLYKQKKEAAVKKAVATRKKTKRKKR